jgi:integrase
MARRGRGEGSVYRRASDGLWVGSLSVSRPGERRRRVYVYGATQAEALGKLAAAREELAEGRPPARESATVAEWMAWWLVHIVARQKRRKPSTVANYRRWVDRWIVPVIGAVRLVDLTAEHVDLVLEHAAEGGLSARSVRHVHAVLRNALNSAKRRRRLRGDVNVAELVEELPHVRRGKVAVLSRVEARRLLDRAAGDRLYALYAAALGVGLRRGEAVAMHWCDVDLDAATVQVRHSVGRVTGHGLVYDGPKSDRSERPVALPAVAVDALREHRRRQLEERLRAGGRWDGGPPCRCERPAAEVDHALVFTKAQGGGYDPRTVLKRFQKLCDDAGIGHRTLREVRHTAASLLLAQGVDVRVVQDILGHSSITVTEGYTHVARGLQTDAAGRMDKLLRGERGDG